MTNKLAKRQNVYDVLPSDLVDEIKKHFPAGTIYIPASPPDPQQQMADRAKEIRNRYRSLCGSSLRRKRKAPLKHLAQEFNLSERQIYNILNDPRYLKEEQ